MSFVPASRMCGFGTVLTKVAISWYSVKKECGKEQKREEKKSRGRERDENEMYFRYWVKYILHGEAAEGETFEI